MNVFLLTTTFASAIVIGIFFGSPILLYGAYKQRLTKTQSDTPNQPGDLSTIAPEASQDSSLPPAEEIETENPRPQPAEPAAEGEENCSAPGLCLCSNCGNCIKSSDKFCVHCGLRLES